MSIQPPGSQRSAIRSAASSVSLERVQRAERVLIGARDARVPPGHVPEVLQTGRVPACAEPQQRRAGVAQLTQKSPARLRVEPRVVRLVHAVVGPDAPMGREVVARLGPRAPAADLRLKLVDIGELRSQSLPVVEVAVEREAAGGDRVTALDSPVRDVGSRDARAVRVLPVDVIHDVAAPAHVREFSREVEPGLELWHAGRLALADDIRRIPAGGGNAGTLQGRHLDLELERACRREVVIQKDAREPPPDHAARAEANRERNMDQRDRNIGIEERSPELTDPQGRAAVREVHERVPDPELRLLVSVRRHTVEGAEEVGLDRGPWGPLSEGRRGVEGEVEAGVPDVAVDDSLVDAGLVGWSGRNLGILALPEKAEQPAVVEQRRFDESADRGALPLSA